MVKKHLKRLNTPKTWDIKRKQEKYILRPLPRGQSLFYSIPLVLTMKSIGIAKTRKEVKYLVNNKEVLIDQKKVSEDRSSIGYMDVLSFPEVKEHYRIILTDRKKIDAIQIDEKEATKKLCKITSKSMNNGKIQVGLHDGRVILTESKEYRVGDSLLIEVPSQKVLSHIKFAPGSKIVLTRGRFISKVGSLKKIEGNTIVFDVEGHEYETLKGYAFALSESDSVDIKFN